MAELDPLTNLPKETSTPEDPERLLQRARESRQRARELRGRSTPIGGESVSGAFGSYDPHFNVVPGMDFNELRAQGQSVPGLIGKSLVQSAAVALGGAVQGIGFLAEIPQAIDSLMTGAQIDFERNIVSSAGKAIEEYGREIAPIYQTNVVEQGDSSRFFDATYWTSHAPSIASTVAMMVPAFGAGMAARGLASIFRLNKLASQATTTVAAAVTSRHTEGFLESYEAFEEREKFLLDAGFSPEEARFEAGKTASDTYRKNYANLALDMLQWGALLRGVNYANRAQAQSILKSLENSTATGAQQLRNSLLRNPAQSLKDAIRKSEFTWKDFLGQSLIEAQEEVNVEIMKNWAMKTNDIQLELDNGDTRSALDQALRQTYSEGETLDAAIFGFLGGATFQAIGGAGAKAMDRNRAKSQIEEIQKVEAHVQQVQSRLSSIDSLLKQGDNIAAEEQFQFMLKDLAVTGFRDGTDRFAGTAEEGRINTTKEMFEGIKNLTNEEIEQLKLGDPETVRAQAEKAVTELNVIEQIYNKNANRTHGTPIDDIINSYLSEQQYINKITDDSITRYSEHITEQYTEAGIKELMDTIDPGKQNYLALIREKEYLEQAKKVLEGEVADSDTTRIYTLPIKKKLRDKTLEDLNERLKQVNEDIAQATGTEGLTKKDISEVKKIDRTLKKNEDLTIAEFGKILREYQRNEGERSLSSYLETENQQFLLNALRKKEEALQKDVANFMVDQFYQDGDFLEKDGEYFQLRKDGDSKSLVPLDQELNLKKEAPIEVTNPEDLLDLYNKREFDQVYSQKDYENELSFIEKSISEHDVKGALKRMVEVLRKTNFANKEEQTADFFEAAFAKHVSQIESIQALHDLNKQLLDYLPSSMVKRAFHPLLNQRGMQIRKQAEAEITAFAEMLSQERDKAEKVADEISKVESRIEDVRSEVDKLKNELRRTAEKKNRTQASILETHYKLRERLNNATKSTKKELNDLNTLRRKLKRQQADIEKNLSVYESLQEKLLMANGVIPSAIIKDDFQQFSSVADQIRAEVLTEFNLTNYGLNKLKKELREGELAVANMESFLTSFSEFLEDLGKANAVSVQAAEQAFERVKERFNIESDEHVMTNLQMDYFLRKYNENLTKLAKDTSGSIRRQVNSFRLSGLEKDTFSSKFVSPQIPQLVEQLRKSLPAIYAYESVLTAMKEAWEVRAVEVEPDREIKDPKDPSAASGEFSMPKRKVENVFQRLAGDSGDTRTGLTHDPAQRRYSKFVNSFNIGAIANQLQVEFMTSAQAGIAIEEHLLDYYEAEDFLYAAVTDKKGRYFTENGNLTDDFDPEVNIYTSVPLATYNSSRMSKSYQISEEGKIVITDAELKKYYPKEKPAAARKLFTEYVERIREEHEEFRAEVREKLLAGEKVYSNILGKSLGVPNEDRSGPKKSLTTLFDRDQLLGDSPTIELEVSTTGVVDLFGESVGVRKGNVVAKDTQTGNMYPLYRRNLKADEVATIVNAFKYMVAKSSTKGKKIDTKVEIEGLTKTVKGKAEPVYASNIIKRYVYALSEGSDIQFVASNLPGGEIAISNTLRDENGKVTGVETNTYALFAQKDGSIIKQMNPALEKALKDKLSTMPMQVHSAELKNNEPFQKYVFEDGEFKQKEYTSYTEYVVTEDVVQHQMKELGSVSTVEGGTEVGQTKDISHYNQNLYYDNSTQAQIEQRKKPQEKEAKLAEKPDADAEGLQDTKTKGASTVASEENQSAINAMLAAASKKEPGKKTAVGDEANQAAIEAMLGKAKGVSGDANQEAINEMLNNAGKNVEVEGEDALSRWEKTQKAEKPEGDTGLELDFEDPPFQRLSQSEVLSERQLGRIASSLSRRLGVNVQILNEQQALALFDNLYQQKQISQRMTAESLPHGMYLNGVAYVFNTGQVRADTPFHEVGHPIISQIIEDNPALFEQLKKEINSTPYGQEIKKYVSKYYPDLIGVNGEFTTSAWAEILVTAIGEQAAQNIIGKANESLLDSLKRLWTQVVEYIKNIIGRETVDIKSMSLDTTIGDIASLLSYSNADISLTPTQIPQYQVSSVFNKDFKETSNLPGKDSSFTYDTMRMMDYVFFQSLFKTHPELVAQVFSGEGLNSDAYSKLLSTVHWQIEKLGHKVYQKARQTNNNYYYKLLNNYTYVIENLAEVQALHKKHLAKYNLESITSETFVEDNTKDSNELWQVEGLKYSSKQNSTSDIRMLIASLSTQTSQNETFYLKTNADFGIVFNLLANQLAGKTNIEQMKATIESTLADRDGMQDLIERVFKKVDENNISNLTTAEANTLLQFRKTFAKNFNKYGIMFSGEEGYKLIDANARTASRRLVEKWNKNVDVRKDNFTLFNNDVVYDLKKMKDKGLFDASALTQADYLLPDKSKYSLMESNYLKAKEFLKQLGIEITSDVVPTEGQFVARVSAIYDSMKKTTSDHYANILSAESDHKQNLFDYIIPHEVENSLDAKENSHVRPSGENIYNVNLFSYLTYVANDINNSNNLGDLLSKRLHLNTPYQRSSLILNIAGEGGRRAKVFNKKGERVSDVDIVFVDAMIDDHTKQSETFDNLSHQDQILITLNSAINNTFPILRAGDNSNERHIRFPEFFTSAEALSGEYVTYLHDYLIDEVNEVKRMLDSPDKYLNVPQDAEQLLARFPVASMLMSNANMKQKILTAVEGETSAISDAGSMGLINTISSAYFEKQYKDTLDYLIEKEILIADGETYKNMGITGITTTSDNVRKDIVERQVKKALVNRFFANVEQTKLWIAPPTYYKNADDLFKRMSGVVGTKNTAAVGHIENLIINDKYPRKRSSRLYRMVDEHNQLTDEFTEYQRGAMPIMRTSVFADPKVTSAFLTSLPKHLQEQYENMEETDAIGLISIDGYRDFLVRTGDWDMYKERLYQWITRDPNQETIGFRNWHTGEIENIYSANQLLNADGTRTVFNMLKPQYFGPLAEEGFVPGMYKTAWIPILPAYANRPALKSIMDFQDNFNTDLVTFVSANKVGAKLSETGELAQIYKDGEVDFDQATIQDTFYEYWGNQLDTGKSAKDKVIKGSQMMKLIDSNIYENGQPANKEDDSLAGLAGEMKTVNNALVLKGVQELKQRLGFSTKTGDYTVQEVENLMDFLSTEAQRRDANANVLDSFEMLKEFWDQTEMGFDVMSNRDKIENILASIADSMVFSQKMPGGSKVQAPVTFFEDELYTKVEEGKRKYNRQGQLLSGTLKFYQDEGVMEVLLPHHFKELFSNLTVDQVDERLRKGIGFRIPTSGLNSIEHIKVVGYLPQEAGETIIVPSEIVVKVGSDFDVDKLNVYLPNYKIKDGKPEYVEYNSSVTAIKNSREQLENRLIEIMGEIISHPDNREQLLEPIGINKIREQEARIVKKLGLPTAEKTMLDVMGNFPYYMDVTRRNIESKKLTGVAALHTSDHSHATRHGYKMSKDHQIEFAHNESDGLISLGRIKNVDGVYISTILNQLINAAVDGAKEPIFFNLNLNLETADVVFYLVRAGVSLDNIFDMLNSDIVRYFTELEGIRKSIGRSERSQKQNISEAAEKFPKQSEILKQYMNYKESAQELSNYLQATRMDTQAMGKNTSELDLILNAASKVYNGESDVVNAEKLLQEGGFLYQHYDALMSIDQMYSNFFLTKKDGVAKQAYDTMVEYVSQRIMSNESRVKVLDKVKSDFITATVLNSPIEIGSKEYGATKDALHLIIGDNTVAHRLQEYQETSTNHLVHALQPVFGKHQYDILGQKTLVNGVKMFDQRQDKIDTNKLIDGYRALFAENFELAADLTRLIFLQGGLSLNPMSFIKIVPAEVYMQILDSAYKNTAPINAQDYLLKFFIANYNDPDIVPTKFGRYKPDAVVYKTFKKLNLTKEQREERKKLNQPLYEAMPTLVANLSYDEKTLQLLTGRPELSSVSATTALIKGNSIRDNRNNVNFVYYGSDISIVAQNEEVQLGDATTTRKEARNLKNLCKPS